jgi:hypothetical protein
MMNMPQMKRNVWMDLVDASVIAGKATKRHKWTNAVASRQFPPYGAATALFLGLYLACKAVDGHYRYC